MPTMHAMRCEAPGRLLEPVALALPLPGPGEVLVEVRACGVCRTDLHLVDGELANARYPVIPGHEIVGTVVASGRGVTGPAQGSRVGVPWLGGTCGHCRYCVSGHENLCPDAQFTGCTRDGGYAEYAVVDARFAFPLPASYGDCEAAPLLCAGLIGYRTLRMAGDPRTVGIWGFGAAAHLVAQVAVAEGREVFAFTRPGDARSQGLSQGALTLEQALEAPLTDPNTPSIYEPIRAAIQRCYQKRPAGVKMPGDPPDKAPLPDIDPFRFPGNQAGGGRSVKALAVMGHSAEPAAFVAISR